MKVYFLKMSLKDIDENCHVFTRLIKAEDACDAVLKFASGDKSLADKLELVDIRIVEEVKDHKSDVV